MHAFLIGIKSFENACGSETPDVYLRLSSYIDWFEEVTNSSFDPLECSYRYAEYRDYEPDIVAYKSDKYQQLNRHNLHFQQPMENEHVVIIEPGHCGGVLIDEKFVLTSRSCAFG